MINLTQYISIIISILLGVISAYITVKISLAEIKKDISYMKEKIEDEIVFKTESIEENKSNMREVREDVKAIFSTLTKIQVEVAKSQGKNENRDEVLNVIRDILKK